MRKRFRPMLDVLEAKIALNSSPIPAPVGVTTPIAPAPSSANLDTAKALVPAILGDESGLIPQKPMAPFPEVGAPNHPVILGSYGGPMPVTLPNVLAAVPRPLYGPLGPVRYT